MGVMCVCVSERLRRKINQRQNDTIPPQQCRKRESLVLQEFSISDIQGLKINPISNTFKLSTFSKINYFITALLNE